MNAKWITRFIDMTKMIASWSKDPSTKVGAVIVDDNNRILSTGYNGFPAGVDDSPELYENRPYKYAHVLHAEENAILHSKHDLTGATLFITHQPCCHCASLIITKGIKAVVFEQPFQLKDNEFDSISYLTNAGVEVYNKIQLIVV